jgi:hypothetical protein
MDFERIEHALQKATEAVAKRGDKGDALDGLQLRAMVVQPNGFVQSDA